MNIIINIFYQIPSIVDPRTKWKGLLYVSVTLKSPLLKRITRHEISYVTKISITCNCFNNTHTALKMLITFISRNKPFITNISFDPFVLKIF